MSIYLKSNAEIAIMKSNGAILAEIFEKLQEVIKPGIKTITIDKLVEDIIYSRFAVASFKGYRMSSTTSFPASACVSVNEEVVHGIPGDRILEEGDIVGVDIGAFKEGFHVDACRTYAVGQISDEAKALIHHTEQSFFEGIKYAQHGNRLSDISSAIQRYLEKHGYSVVRDLFGHGIGRSLHEEPTIPNFGMSGRGPKLRNGMVLAIEPMVNVGDYRIDTLADGWTVVTKDRKLSAHYENTVALTPDGCLILTLN